jgi:CHASE2 domain-containing sensor protein
LRKSLFALIRAAPIAGVLAIVLNSVGVVKHLEKPVQDILMRAAATPSDSEVAIVDITNEDYESLFDARSPLNPARLQQLVEAIARGNPKVIGVDIDTAGPQFESLGQVTWGSQVVWARDAAYSNVEKRFYPSEVLGGAKPEPESGLVLLSLDSDGVTRRYIRVCETDRGLFPAFHWAVLGRFIERNQLGLSESTNEMLIEYTGDPKRPYRSRLNAAKVLSMSHDPGWLTNSLIKDKIVLLGGTYRGQDEHQTPLGWMAGVDVLAQIIDTDLRGGGIRPASSLVTILVTIIAGLVLWSIIYRIRFWKGLLFGLIAIPVTAMLSSLVAFHTVAQSAYFTPILLAVLAERLYDNYKLSADKAEHSTKGKKRLA